MNIIPKKLILENFGSWKRCELDLENCGSVLVRGKTGSGKSTIFKGKHWVVYGEIPEGAQADEIVNEQIGKNTVGRYIFQIGDDLYEIVRYRRHKQWKNKVVLKKNGKLFGQKDSKIDVINKAIVSLIGIDAKTSTQIEFLVQRDWQRFPMMTDTQQKKMIEELTELQLIPSAEKLARERLQETKHTLDVLHEIKKQQQHNLKLSRNVFKEQKLQELKARNIIKASIKTAKSRLEDATADYEAAKKDFEDAKKQYKKLERELTDAEAMESVLKEEIKKINNRLKKAREYEIGSTCERCGATLTEEQIKTTIQTLETEIQKASVSHSASKDKIRELKEAIKQINYDKLEETYTKAEKNYENWKQYLKTKKVELKKETVETSPIKEAVKATLAELRRTVMLQTVHRRLRDKYEFWVIAFGRKGIRALILPQILKDLETRINMFLQIFSTSLKASYKLEEGRIIQRYFKPGRKPRSYATLSGGERQMVDLSTSLSLRELAEISRGSSVDLVVLDEQFEGIDSDLIQKVPKILSTIKKGSIFVISHSDHLEPYFKQVLTVQMKHDASTFV